MLGYKLLFFFSSCPEIHLHAVSFSVPSNSITHLPSPGAHDLSNNYQQVTPTLDVKITPIIQVQVVTTVVSPNIILTVI
jgi:hypothetical protein